MTHKNWIYTIILLIGLVGYGQNQRDTNYTLEACIAIALENNLDLKSSILAANTAKVNFQQSKANLLPNINGNFNLGVNDGRSIDPFTNDFINQKLTFSNAGLNLDATIFNGFRLLNTAKQNRLNKSASEMETEATKQDLVLRVTLAYLQVLNNNAILDLNNARLKTTEQQLQIQKDFYENESGNPADYADILGQLASDETSILVSESNLNNSKLDLATLMNLDNKAEVDAKNLMLDFERYDVSADEVYKDAINNLATFKAGALRIEAAKKSVSIAKSQFTPDISVFGGVNTNYSGAAELFTATSSSIIETGDFVNVDGQDLPILTEQTAFESQNINYRDQFDNNLNTVIGIAVRVSIFNGFKAKNNVALEKIKMEEAILELQRTHLEIKNTIAQVHFDMEATYQRYESLLKQVEAYEQSYRINEIRYNSGISNFLNYISSKNNLDNANVNLSNATYEYLLLVKVLEYYRGNGVLN